MHFLALGLAFVGLSLSLAAASPSTTMDTLCKADTDCSENEACAGGRCSCQPGAIFFTGTCEPQLSHGERCSKQVQCSMGGDPSLQCQPAVDGDFSTMTCLCSRGYDFDAAVDKCKKKAMSRPDPPPHITKKKMTPRKKEDMMRVLRKNLTDIYGYDHSFAIPEPEVLGPIAVTGVFLILFICCLCFWSARGPSSDSAPGDDYLRNTYGVQATDATFNNDLENGNTLRKTKLDGGFDGVANELNNSVRGGVDNPCFNQGRVGGDADALSHYTSSTEICETSQKEYIASTANQDKAADVKLTNDNARMLFAHAAAADPAVSLTGSMDEADVEVAGLYRKFSQPSPVMLRMDSHGKLSPPTQPGLEDAKSKRPHKIELVETPDCTSIDTTIPEDEIRDMNERKKSYLELMTEAREAKEQKKEEEEDDKTLSEDTSAPEDEEEEEEERVKPEEASEYIDDVFKPVFATA